MSRIGAAGQLTASDQRQEVLGAHDAKRKMSNHYKVLLVPMYLNILIQT